MLILVPVFVVYSSQVLIETQKHHGKAVVRYRANVKGVVRAEADSQSANVGNLEKGEELH